MQMPILTLPRAIPPERMRASQVDIPQERADRQEFKQRAAAYVEQFKPVPPLSVEELRRHSDEFLRMHGLDPIYRNFVAVLLNSELWRESLATVPFERRLLLLPKCLRVEDKCPAPFDDFGLLCKQCGLCTIQELQAEAERLGYAVLVAEGSALVMAIIQTGKIDAIVGVSCLSVLEKAFPYMESAAIPGVAIPLLQDDCKDTTIDVDWVWDTIHLTSDDKTNRMDLEALRREVDSWFEPAALDRVMGRPQNQTDQIARDWLAQSGKRWRPFLAACAFQALQEDPHAPLPAGLRKIAVAVECFHKASLVHDDIEDNDPLRYGEQTLHEKYGVAIALNTGDMLLGEGYRLLATCDAPAEVKGEMMRIAAEGHRTLCIGQGAELCWTRSPEPLSILQVIDIFRKKTAPAFEVALQLGAAYAGADQEIADILTKYSEALGIAYQIRDDVDDLTATHAGDDIAAQRPSLPLAIALDRTKDENRAVLEKVWCRQANATAIDRARALITQTGADERCRNLLESYKEEAIRSLADLEHASLKGLLRRVIGKIFTLEVKGWCNEFEARNAPGRKAGTQAVG